MPKAQLKNEGEEEVDSKPYTQKKRTGGKAWTSEEIVMLFKFVEKHGLGGGKIPWHEAVPGRTGSQSSKTWKVTYSPFIVSELMKRGK